MKLNGRMEKIVITCKLCGKKFKNLMALSNHIRYKHPDYANNKCQKYFDSFLDKDENKEHLCKNKNCTNKCKFLGLTKGYSKTCSEKCGRQFAGRQTGLMLKGKPSPRRGIRDSYQVKINKKNARKKFLNSKEGKTWKKMMSDMQKGKNNTCFKISEQTKIEMKKKQSTSMKKLIEAGLFTPCVTNSWANSKVPIKINEFDQYYRSSWDAVFQILNPTIKYEKIRIPYIGSDNQQHIYIVDFVDENKKILFEIKPEKLKTSKENLLKTKAAIKWCEKNNYEYKIISNDYFKKNARKIDYSIYDKKIFNGMKQFL